ncbi:glycosyltransferase family A protein [Vibrio chagasii]|uniref:glycosyltransferase family A protein n=1 Tax=Vibrio chagasii TaxID=170679 RepID=UPI0038CD7793
MSSKLLFSVVIPVYNKENYISDTLESVANQSNIANSYYEIILVNDGSSDNSEIVINSFIEKNINLNIRLFSINNQGVSNARNFGVKQARGIYICFLDADDLISGIYLATLKNKIEKTENIDFLATNYTNCLSDLTVREQDVIFEEKNYITDKLRLCSSSVCIKRDIFDEEFYRFDISQTHGEDTDVWFRVAIDFNVFYTQDFFAYYNNSVPNSAINSVQVLNDSQILNKDFLLNKISHKVPKDTLVERIDEIRFIYILSCIRRKEFKLALKHLNGINSIMFIIFNLGKKIKNKYVGNVFR